MSLAPSVAVPRASFNRLPLYIGLFCLLWSFAFVAGKIGVTDCPPLILLTARFLLAGILILGISALRSEELGPFLARRRGVRNSRRRQQRALSRLRLHRPANRLGRPRRPRRQRQSGLHRRARRCLPRRDPDLAQGERALARHRRRHLHRLASPVGRHGSFRRHRVHAGLAGVDRRRHHPVQGAGAKGHRCGSATASRTSPAASRCCRSRPRFAHVGDIVPSARLFGAFAFLVLGGSILGLPALVPSPESVRRHRCQRLPFPDAAARHAVRLPRARRARGDSRPARASFRWRSASIW